MRSILCLSAALALASSAFAGPLVRVQSAPAEPKCNAAQCRARAAFAFEQLAAEKCGERTAPAPHAKACPCGAGCECAAGVCPACPAATTSANSAGPVQVAYYREEWRTDARGKRVRELVPVYGDAPTVPTVSLPCVNGKCALPR